MSNGRIVNVNAQGSSYDIVIGQGILSQIGERLTDWKGQKVAIVSDETVADLYASTVIKSLEKEGIASAVFTIPPGEESKSHTQLMRLYSELIEAGITRSDLIIALGGGVTGDLAGFLAATYMRGVPCVQIPTTLLAQVDSSVGGKVAVDLPEGKNLVGVFSQPILVWIDIDTLSTLPQREFAAGMAEVIKYGCILDDRFFQKLAEEDIADQMPEVIARCCELKAEIVSEDPLDKGNRMLLNFGHTLGHAVEKASGYGTVLHGEGVAIGMVGAAHWGEQWGETVPGTSEEIALVLKKYNLPTTNPLTDPSVVAKAMGADKKSSGQDIDVVLLKEIGRGFWKRMAKRELIAQIQEDMTE